MKPEREAGTLLIRRGLTLAIAESCTGGLIAHRITNVPGSSAYFDRGFVVYSNNAKIELLGIEASLIKESGAVSDKVAQAMAEGARRASGADVGLAVTGIAGPISDESKKPVGLVYIAATANDGSTIVQKHQFSGTRLQIKKQTAEGALALLVKMLGA